MPPVTSRKGSGGSLAPDPMQNESVIIERYHPDRKEEWNRFVNESRNATFLLLRDYMDYHADRFADCSLMIRRSDGKLMALLPASAHGKEVRSHGGLTYGGLVMPYAGDFTAATAINVFGAILRHYAADGVETLVYKPIPHIYHKYPAEEDLYAVFRCGGVLSECNVASTIDLSRPIRFNNGSRCHMRKCLAGGVIVGEETDPADFWHVLAELLRSRYGTEPVHSLDEMRLLQSRFPGRICCFGARSADGELLGGILLYFCGETVHSQYTAATEQGKRLGVLALLYDYVIRHECGDARYFDFGTCNENHGLYLNEGLIQQKNGMGGRAIVYPTYRIACRANGLPG